MNYVWIVFMHGKIDVCDLCICKVFSDYDSACEFCKDFNEMDPFNFYSVVKFEVF